jgi:C-terminal processing protease CtpA/Prc
VDTLLERMDLIQALLDEKTVSATERRERRKLAETLNPLAGAFGFAEKAFEKQKRRSTTNHRKLDEDSKNGKKDDEDDEMINTDDHLEEAEFPVDMDIDFGPVDLTFARKAYRLSTIPDGAYNDILCQNPDGSLLLIKDGTHVEVFQTEGYPSDQYESKSFKAKTRSLSNYGLSASRKFIYLVYNPDGAIRVVPNTAAGTTSLLADDELDENVVDKEGMHLSVWPSLEYRQMYDDAWRMLRDYFYDPDMTGIDWSAIHERFLPLVERCTKREELDDVLVQMASELSALHVFVYGGEYNSPMHDNDDLEYVNEVGSLGAILKRTPAWKGYTVMNIPEADPDFTKIDHSATMYSPLSDQSLRLSGQRGLQVGDVIVGVNGESVMSVPDIHMLLRGTAGRSIRLDVLRLTSGTAATTYGDDEEAAKEATVESLITVPISPSANADLLYGAWEYKTEQKAEELAAKAGISVGYVHMKDMSGAQAEDAFARGFFPNYKKQGFILDVRHNRGGNIDSWVLDVLQRKPWMYWQSRDFDASNGGLDWDMHFAFRGHVIVLLDEKTSSDGEGVSRGIKELGLGKLIGTRTWGGGIWLSSDNHLVDGGIATAPEIGTFNDHINWGLGIEQMGVDPDIVVDNDPHEAYTGKDRQLERAIVELKKWIEEEPVVIPKPKGKRKDMTMGDRECKAPSPEQNI